MNQTVKVTVDVPANDAEAFRQLYRDFIEGKTPYQAQAEAKLRELGDAQARGVESLQALYDVARRDSGQCRYIARFLAGVYNGYRFPYDLTDFRGLDRELFDHCLRVLVMDKRPAKEVHQYFPDGGQKWEAMIERWGLTAEQVERARELVRYADENQ